MPTMRRAINAYGQASETLAPAQQIVLLYEGAIRRIKEARHAIEARLCAEDPAKNFLPQAGTMALWIPADGVRTDHALESDAEISPHYDSMIAKVIVHGRDRQEAIARMRRTLEMTVIEGISTSVPLHLKILNEPDFQAGRLGTGFMERFMPKPKNEKLAETA